MRIKGQSGFTIIELMITLVVLAILVALAVPNMRDLIDKSRLRGATDDIVNLLNTARASAVKYGRDVNVSIKPAVWCAGAVSSEDQSATTAGIAVSSVKSCDCAAPSTACQIGQQLTVVSSSSYSGVTLGVVNTSITYSSGASGEGLTFNSKLGSLDLTALPVGSLLTVVSPSAKYSTQITVSPLGQTQVCSLSSKFISGYPSC